MAQGDPRKWHMPGWRIEQKYSPGVLIGNWGEDRYTVSISCCFFFFLFALLLLCPNHFFSVTTGPWWGGGGRGQLKHLLVVFTCPLYTDLLINNFGTTALYQCFLLPSLPSIGQDSSK